METLVQQLLARTGLLTIAEVSDLLDFHPVSLRNWSAPESCQPCGLLASGDSIRQNWRDGWRRGGWGE